MHSPKTASPDRPKLASRWLGAALIAFLALALLRLLRPPAPELPTATASPETTRSATSPSRPEIRTNARPRIISSAPNPKAEEIVAAKLAQFARSRRELAHALARRRNVTVPDEVERFFAAVESGNWDAIAAAFQTLEGGESSGSPQSSRSAEVNALWPAIHDAYGVAEQVHDWPAQQLLDYGNAILDSLRPGMVYVGGTDNGRWIPELLNDTSGGERHIILTQNALADSLYLDYVAVQYGERFQALTPVDSQRAFADYSADAARRFAHDRDFPDEPKQIRPGEMITAGDDGRISVSGQVAVMDINERLLTGLMAKNPDLSFAVQESSPLQGTYADALPLGPLMELRAKSEGNNLTAVRASETLAYWEQAAGEILGDAATSASPSALKSYSHDAVATGNLLESHGHLTQAEATFRLARQISPANPEPVFKLGQLLDRSGRTQEARSLVEEFFTAYPEQRERMLPIFSDKPSTEPNP
jgi:tetratricopeptide (TPR) repeat protein